MCRQGGYSKLAGSGNGYRSVCPGRNVLIKAFCLGSVLGTFAFCVIYGVKILGFRYDAWVLTGGDLTQHYLGWCLYRSSSWTFPIGLTPEYAWPCEISAMYADVIPLCAVGALFFIVGSPMMYRMYLHTALGTQWILILALIFLFCRDWLAGKLVWRLIWGGMGCLCVWVHGYFVPMVFLVMLTSIYMHWWKAGEIKEGSLLIACYLLGVMASMWVLGAFTVSIASEGRLGEFGANLDTFFNPILPSMSRFMPVFPIVGGQLDGYAYLGLGGILLLLFSLVKALWMKSRGENLCGCYAPVIFLWFVCMAMAIFPKVCFHDIVLFTIDYPDFITSVMLVFRGNGRFVWIPFYLLMLFAIVKATIAYEASAFLKGVDGRRHRCSCSRLGVVIVMLLLVLQWADYSIMTKAIGRNIHDGLGNYINSVIKGEKFHATVEGNSLIKGFEAVDEIIKGYRYVAYTDYNYVYNLDASLMIAYFAHKNDVKMEAFYLARMPKEHLQAEQDKLLIELREGNPREDTLYIIADREAVREYKGLFYREVNGVMLGSKKPLN